MERNEWEIREDAQALLKTEEIRRDPARLKEAQGQIRKDKAVVYGALSLKPARSAGAALDAKSFNDAISAAQSDKGW
jgi:hypothetical protein